MKFQQKFEAKLFSGEKNITTRLHKKPEYEVGNVYTIDIVRRNAGSVIPIIEFKGYLTIIRNQVWPLGIVLHGDGFPVFPFNMTEGEFLKKEGFSNKDKFIEFFRTMYPKSFKKIKVATTYQFQVKG